MEETKSIKDLGLPDDITDIDFIATNYGEVDNPTDFKRVSFNDVKNIESHNGLDFNNIQLSISKIDNVLYLFSNKCLDETVPLCLYVRKYATQIVSGPYSGPPYHPEYYLQSPSYKLVNGDFKIFYADPDYTKGLYKYIICWKDGSLVYDFNLIGGSILDTASKDYRGRELSVSFNTKRKCFFSYLGIKVPFSVVYQDNVGITFFSNL